MAAVPLRIGRTGAEVMSPPRPHQTLDRPSAAWSEFPSLWLDACEVRRPAGPRVHQPVGLPWAQLVKRAFDIAVALDLSSLAFPLCGSSPCSSGLAPPGPVFYSQDRIGGQAAAASRPGSSARMCPDADQVLEQYLAEHPDLRAEWQANHKLQRRPADHLDRPLAAASRAWTSCRSCGTCCSAR